VRVTPSQRLFGEVVCEGIGLIYTAVN
jgi:hypothetical protein